MRACRRTAILFFGTVFCLLFCFFPIPSSAAKDSEELFSPQTEISVSRSGLFLKWEDVPNAAYYRIRRFEKNVTVLVKETSAHLWLDTEAPDKAGLHYSVTSVDKNGNESEPVWHYARYLSTPKPRATEVLAGFCVKWDAVDGAKEYEISRKSENGEWELLATTASTAYTDATASPIGSYTYSVTAVCGNIRSLSAKCEPKKLAWVPETLGSVPDGFEVSVFGQSGEGRDLLVYRYGSGENVLLMTFAIHGWEDSFDRDGRAHVYTAYRLMNSISDWNAENWTIYVVPLANPDGLLDGSGNYGPGRCTTMMYDKDGNLVEGGIDINRSFPSYWSRYYSGRNRNGSAPLACPESEAICRLMEDCRGDGRNIYVDVHGWTEQVISANWGWYEYWAFASRFPSCSLAYCGTSSGYAAAHAATLGYSSGLFEFPQWHWSLSSFVQSSLPDRFVRSIKDIVEYYN
ncbi:MAG: hypothetical protein IIX84_03925 [Oscillospiraceae bacterium]|nr:hypothetical protein [Oscillospiraceae bacterium]